MRKILMPNCSKNEREEALCLYKGKDVILVFYGMDKKNIITGNCQSIYAKNRNVVLEEFYKDDILNGDFKKYDLVTGILIQEGIYKNNVREGVLKEYHEVTSSLIKEATYKNGILNGPYKLYDNETEKLTELSFYKKGKLVASLTRRLRIMQVLDDVKGAMGINKRNIVELNEAQSNKLLAAYNL